MKIKAPDPRIAIANYWGWHHLIHDKKFLKKWWGGQPIGVPPGEDWDPEKPTHQILPDINDLNVLHDFLMFLRNKDNDAYYRYVGALVDLMDGFNTLPEQQAYHHISRLDAPADMRVKAIVIALDFKIITP